MTDAKPRVVAVIPCYNTAPHIAEVVTKCLPHVDQVIVIDDGSTDDTAEIVRTTGAEVISHDNNLGYGEAIKSCFAAARKYGASILVTIDGDGQHNPDEIPALLIPIVNGEADLVIGSRFLGSQTNMPRYREFGIRVITWLFNLGSKVRLSDAQSGFRAYGKKIFESLPFSEKGMSVSIEILEKARRNRAIIKEVPTSCYYPPSTLNLRAIRHGLSVALSVVIIRLKNSLRSLVEGENVGR